MHRRDDAIATMRYLVILVGHTACIIIGAISFVTDACGFHALCITSPCFCFAPSCQRFFPLCCCLEAGPRWHVSSSHVLVDTPPGNFSKTNCLKLALRANMLLRGWTNAFRERGPAVCFSSCRLLEIHNLLPLAQDLSCPLCLCSVTLLTRRAICCHCIQSTQSLHLHSPVPGSFRSLRGNGIANNSGSRPH